jgi:hypothetical protein
MYFPQSPRLFAHHQSRMTGTFLTLWTIRLALACYVATAVVWLARPGSRWQSFGRWLWTAGCSLFLAHVACAMQFTHEWSHASALAKTARETHELLGFEFGAGIYFSYLFLAVWVADVVWSWFSPASYLSRPNWVACAIHGYLLFIAANGAIVFEDGPTRPLGIAALAALAALAAWVYCTQHAARRRSLPSAESAA